MDKHSSIAAATLCSSPTPLSRKFDDFDGLSRRVFTSGMTWVGLVVPCTMLSLPSSKGPKTLGISEESECMPPFALSCPLQSYYPARGERKQIQRRGNAQTLVVTSSRLLFGQPDPPAPSGAQTTKSAQLMPSSALYSDNLEAWRTLSGSH